MSTKSYLRPTDASILSMIACAPSIRTKRHDLYNRLYERLHSPLSKEIASVLTAEVDSGQASEQARGTAEAMKKWVGIQAERQRNLESLRAKARRRSRRPDRLALKQAK